MINGKKPQQLSVIESTNTTFLNTAGKGVYLLKILKIEIKLSKSQKTVHNIYP